MYSYEYYNSYYPYGYYTTTTASPATTYYSYDYTTVSYPTRSTRSRHSSSRRHRPYVEYYDPNSDYVVRIRVR
jgi:hypothetical protein